MVIRVIWNVQATAGFEGERVFVFTFLFSIEDVVTHQAHIILPNRRETWVIFKRNRPAQGPAQLEPFMLI